MIWGNWPQAQVPPEVWAFPLLDPGAWVPSQLMWTRPLSPELRLLTPSGSLGASSGPSQVGHGNCCRGQSPARLEGPQRPARLKFWGHKLL